MKTLTAVLHKEEDMYVAECPEVGTASQGKTIDEAVSNLKEATELYLEEFPVKEKQKKSSKNSLQQTWLFCQWAFRFACKIVKRNA